ncbi:MAG TPA: hypothetical protein VHY36_13370 [Steroidobacteraceae bacterium]|jgi:hypothetical protein|nr:hypothetical protein [Steroidobacteraceae bacterium]
METSKSVPIAATALLALAVPYLEATPAGKCDSSDVQRLCAILPPPPSDVHEAKAERPIASKPIAAAGASDVTINLGGLQVKSTLGEMRPVLA